MLSRESPITSERISAITVAGKANLASRPPFTFEICFLIALIS